MEVNFSKAMPADRGKFQQINNAKIIPITQFKEQNGDVVEVSKENQAPKGEKVTFKEGVKLVAKGFLNKVKGMAQAITKHPVKAALAVAGTALALYALPLIGISTATGAAVLAIGYAAKAVFSTTKDIVKTVKDNKAGEYNKVREDLGKVGGDALDLALSLPFVPKAMKQINRTIRYGRATIGLNKELINDLSHIKNIKEVPKEFAKANTKINYEMIANEMGLKVKPELKFFKKDFKNGQTMAGEYEPATGTLKINENILYGKGKSFLRRCKLGDPEIIIRHELEHFKQFSDIAKAQGSEGLKNVLSKYYTEAAKKLGNLDDVTNLTGARREVVLKRLEAEGIESKIAENMLFGDKSAFNSDFYNKFIESQGTISAGTQEAEAAAKYAAGFIEKVNPSAENIARFNDAVKGIDQSFGGAFMTKAEKMKFLKAQIELYKSNILEKEAFNAQDIFAKQYIKYRPTPNTDVILTLNSTAEPVSDEQKSEEKKDAEEE